ncbi:MAG: hypothetical protein V9F00_12180 [Nocardioides sp.]
MTSSRRAAVVDPAIAAPTWLAMTFPSTPALYSEMLAEDRWLRLVGFCECCVAPG